MWGCRAAQLVPGHPVALVPACHAVNALPLSQAGQARLLSLPVGRSPCLPGQGGRGLLVHSPPVTEADRHWPCAMSPPSPGHRQGHGARA